MQESEMVKCCEQTRTEEVGTETEAAHHDHQ